ncbi:MAG TPA: hypothetical protein VGI81_23235 [Tepidisphaeraceae bacterium]|jgi:hypothetical protein
MPSQKSPRLIANTLPRLKAAPSAPVMRSLDHAAVDPKAPPQHAGGRDPYRIADRAIDHVVDRLLEELTW